MKALHCLGDGRVTIAEVPDPQPGPGEALVRIEASAVCGSERILLTDGVDALPAYHEDPAMELDGTILNGGHEACGVVVEPGSSDFAVGERVGLAGMGGCGECDQCRGGREIHCRRGATYLAMAGWHAELAALPGSALRELPKGTTPAVGALLSGDTLGVAGRANHRDPSAPGECVLVIGLGPVGLGHVAIRAFGGAEVIGIEPSEYRRELALGVGAKVVLETGAEIGVRPQMVIECSGRPESIALALELVDDAGTVHQSGVCSSEVTIDPADFYRREITYTGDMYYANEDYPSMLELVAQGLPLERLCTHEVDAAEAEPAIADFLAGRSGKVVLRWG